MRSCSGSSIPSILNNGAISNKEIPLWQDIRHGGICFIHGSSDLSQVLQRTVLNQISRQNVVERYGEQMHIFSQPIDYSIKVAEHPAVGISLLEYAPKNAAALSYRAAAEEVMRNG